MFGIGGWRSRLEREAEGAKVVVETEDGAGAALGRGDGADAVGERQCQAGMAFHQVPGARVELGVGVTDDQTPRLDGFLEQAAERESRVEPRVEPQPRGGLRDDEVGRQQDVAPVAQRCVVVADSLVRAVAAPEERDERARVGVDDPQARSFGVPYR